MKFDTSRDREVDAAVDLANRYPQETVDRLPLDEVSDDLMGEIMNGQKDTLADEPTRGRRPWFVPLVAAAAVATLVGGGFALRDLGGEQSGQEGAPASAAPSNSPKALKSTKTTKDPETEKAPKDSLPPTADNLNQVVVEREGWAVSYLEDSGKWGGSLTWEKGASSVEVRHVPSADYDTTLMDRKEIGPPEEVSLLGQDGTSFTYPEMGDPSVGPGEQELQNQPELSGKQADHPKPSGKQVDLPSVIEDDGATDESVRVTTVLPPVGGFFLELDVMVADQAEYDDVIASLRRVEEAEWFDAMGDGVVTPADGDAFLAEAGRDVPMPDGVEITPEDLNLPQDSYYARATFVAPVLCGWAEQYVAGDEAALTVLKESKDWPVLQAMKGEGGYPGAVRDSVRELEQSGQMAGFRQAVGC